MANGTTIDVFVINCTGNIHRIPLGKVYIQSLYAAIVFVSLLVIPIIVLNMLIAWVVLSTKVLHNPSNILLLSTAICDLLSALLGMCEWVGVWTLGLNMEKSCLLYYFAVYCSHVLSYLSFLFVWFISMDRYLAIFKPFWYSMNISSNLKIYIRLVLLSSVVFCILKAVSFIVPNKVIIENIIVITLPFLILHCVYVHIQIHLKVKSVRKNITLHNRVKNNNTIRADMTSVGSNSTSIIATKSNMKMSKQKLETQVNMSYLTFLMLISLCVWYTPYLIIITIQMVESRMRSNRVINILYMWSYAILCVKALMNPLIYCYRSTTIRIKMKKILSKNVVNAWQSSNDNITNTIM